jgi:glycosyltransferase involved in cell wall biosynthesis
MQVDHVSFSRSGGAGRVARDIAEAQRRAGLDAEFIHLIDRDLVREPFKSGSVTFGAALDKYLLANSSATTLTSLARSSVSNLGRIQLRSSSIINLHWIEGLLTTSDLKGIVDSGRKLVWTMHDMKPLTGFCHQSHGCSSFQSTCRDCPQARKIFRPLVESNLSKKSRLLPSPESLRVVVPSNWMRERVEESSLFKNYDADVIPNPVGQAYMVKKDQGQSRVRHGLQENDFVAVSIAEQLDSKGKQIHESIEGFFLATEALGVPAKYILIGGGGEAFRSRPGVLHFGVQNSEGVSSLISASNVLINMSLAESAGMTVLEAAALGVPSIVRNVGGMRESVNDGVSGFLCDGYTDYVSKLQSLSSRPDVLRRAGEMARTLCLAKHSSQVVADSYIDLYGQLA